MVLTIDALPEPESALTVVQSECLARFLVKQDWEERTRRAESIVTLLARVEIVITEWNESNTDTIVNTVSRAWRKEATTDLKPLLDDWADYGPARFLQAFDALVNVINDYRFLLIDDEKIAGHLLRRHGLSGKKIIAAGDEVDDLHAALHAHRFDHA